jgi:hypothetical protein
MLLCQSAPWSKVRGYEQRNGHIVMKNLRFMDFILLYAIVKKATYFQNLFLQNEQYLAIFYHYN